MKKNISNELNRNHEIELEALKTKAIEAYKKSCTFYKEGEGCFGNFLKNQLTQSNLTLECTSDCEFFNKFITELNK